jgi:dihydroorotase
MLTRREFFSAAAAGAATLSNFSRPPELRAAQYDLLIKGGRVIDPSRNFDAVADIGIAGGRIAAVRPNVDASSAAETIVATDKLIVPGFIDIHTHAGNKEMPATVLWDGVTSIVDAGSQGADHVDDVVAIARSAPNRMRVLVNIARTGILGEGELMDISRVDVAATRQAIERNRDMIVGIKARLSRTVAGANDLEALRRAQAVARPLNIPVMIHIGDTVSPLPAILALLKRGDIVTHMYSPPPHGIFDDAGLLLPEVTAARRRGVWFDVGHGRIGHITWAVVQHAMNLGVLPDTISSDWTEAGRTDQVFDFGNVLSKFLMLGMPTGQVIARGTVNAAKVFGAFKGLGTLRVGAPADVAILELRRGTFEFVDNAGARRVGDRRLFASAVFYAGKRALPV